MDSTPTLHMWHDYVCPFCNVEATRIMHIKEAERLDLDIRYHPRSLELANGTQPSAEDEDQWVRLLRTVEPDAFTWWNPYSGFWPASSALLFAAYEAALSQDITAAGRFDLLVRQAIFQNPRPIDSITTLSELAASAGLDVAAFRVMLEDGSAELQAHAAGDLEIRGIPTLVLPDGSKVVNPGLKIRRTEQGRTIHDDLPALRQVLRQAAEGVPARSPHG